MASSAMPVIGAGPDGPREGALAEIRLRALDEVRQRGRPELIGELVYDVVTRRAEVRGVPPTVDEVAGRAAELGLSSERLAGELADLVETLVHGPQVAQPEGDLARVGAYFA